MAVIDFNRVSAPSEGFVGRAVRRLYGVVAQLRTWNDLRATRKALSKLSDRELADIGLSRGDVDDLELGALIR